MASAKEAFLDIHRTEPKQAVVVSHGGLLSAAFKALLDIPQRSRTIQSAQWLDQSALVGRAT